MEIIINGKSSAGAFKNINDLLSREDLDPKLVVVELNGKILPKEDYDKPLRDGDAVEIVQFVAGG
ncbi:MAG: sulfur carrier protein ThiS [Desulfovibrio sp.]|nr:sulfur carrier protein ThiS [Desulfovibrio sp.]